MFRCGLLYFGLPERIRFCCRRDGACHFFCQYFESVCLLCRIGKGRLKVGFQTTSMLTANEIVKEQILQTTSKKVLRSSEKQKPRACVPHTPYVRTEGFCPGYGLLRLLYIYTMLRQFINHQDFLLNNLKTPQMISQ